MAEIQDSMSHAEFVSWAAFFELREQERERDRKKAPGGKRKKG